MNRNRETYYASGFSVDVMAAMDAEELPAVSFNQLGERLVLRKPSHYDLDKAVLTRRLGRLHINRHPSTAS
jgi:hypothetical protein